MSPPRTADVIAYRNASAAGGEGFGARWDAALAALTRSFAERRNLFDEGDGPAQSGALADAEASKSPPPEEMREAFEDVARSLVQRTAAAGGKVPTTHEIVRDFGSARMEALAARTDERYGATMLWHPQDAHQARSVLSAFAGEGAEAAAPPRGGMLPSYRNPLQDLLYQVSTETLGQRATWHSLHSALEPHGLTYAVANMRTPTLASPELGPERRGGFYLTDGNGEPYFCVATAKEVDATLEIGALEASLGPYAGPRSAVADREHDGRAGQGADAGPDRAGFAQEAFDAYLGGGIRPNSELRSRSVHDRIADYAQNEGWHVFRATPPAWERSTPGERGAPRALASEAGRGAERNPLDAREQRRVREIGTTRFMGALRGRIGDDVTMPQVLEAMRSASEAAARGDQAVSAGERRREALEGAMDGLLAEAEARRGPGGQPRPFADRAGLARDLAEQMQRSLAAARLEVVAGRDRADAPARPPRAREHAAAEQRGM